MRGLTEGGFFSLPCHEENKNMKRMKLLYGTGNSSKLRAMREVLSQFDIEILGLKDMPEEPPHVEEDGTTPLENARKKALHYYKA